MIAKFTRKDFLEALFSDYYREHRGFIMVRSVRRGDPKMSTRYFPNIEILAKEHYGEERDVYFGICPRERMKAEKEHIHYLVSLWADLDIGADGHEGKKVYFEGPQQAARAISLLGGKLREVKEIDLKEFADQRHLVIIDKVSPTPPKYPRRPGIPRKRPII